MLPDSALQQQQQQLWFSLVFHSIETEVPFWGSFSEGPSVSWASNEACCDCPPCNVGWEPVGGGSRISVGQHQLGVSSVSWEACGGVAVVVSVGSWPSVVFLPPSWPPGIGFSNGETWRQLRQFATATLCSLEERIQERIQEEAGFLVESLWSMKGRPLDPSRLLSRVTTNILCSVAFGSRFDYEDEEFLRFIHLLEENARLQSCTMTKACSGAAAGATGNHRWVYNVFPSVLDYCPGSHQTIFKNTNELKQFISRRVKKEAPQPGTPRGFIDAFLLKMEQEKWNSRSAFSPQSLERSTLDLFVAGAESTSLVLKYMLLALMKYPEVQEKVRQDIDRVIGPSQTPCLADLSQMPYTDAVIHEVHRSLALVPLNVPHAVTKDTLFRQYLIPKGTTIFPALKASLYDKAEFPHPERFDPGHFLDGKGALRKSEFFIPFSIGQRACLGERMASVTIFVCLATLLQHFRLRPHVPPEELDLSPTVGFLTTAPKPYQLSLDPRW
ncbi:hypothetical protein JD844_020182 [Phrynosoma platyrhinos]|uniref:unspecific monooxygenase n=1 Tax=Phrynosoma platyrhinos TaxID=52577 RepID=A0ABQ7SS69_PHRPL|nr:hypothetical protein JD844_020182 [Phrynosoma platyrhinos]